MSFVSFGTNSFGDKTCALLVAVHLSKLIRDRHYLSLTGFKSIKVALNMHASSFNEKLLKLNSFNKHLFDKAEHYFIYI